MDDQPKPPSMGKVFLMPLIVATVLAIIIRLAAPQLDIFAWGSAWAGTFIMLSIWNLAIKR